MAGVSGDAASRNERRAGGSAMEDPRNSADRPPSARRIEARGGRAPSIEPDYSRLRWPRFMHPIQRESNLRRPHSRTPRPPGANRTRTGRGARRRGGAGRRGRARSRAVAPQPRPEIPGCNGRAGKHAAAATGRQLGAPTNSALLRRGRPVGRLTIDDCASRNGVASGPLYAVPMSRFTPRPSDSARGAVESIPLAAASVRPSAGDAAPPARYPRPARVTPSRRNPPCPPQNVTSPKPLPAPGRRPTTASSPWRAL